MRVLLIALLAAISYAQTEDFEFVGLGRCVGDPLGEVTLNFTDCVIMCGRNSSCIGYYFNSNRTRCQQVTSGLRTDDNPDWECHGKSNIILDSQEESHVQSQLYPVLLTILCASLFSFCIVACLNIASMEINEQTIYELLKDFIATIGRRPTTTTGGGEDLMTFVSVIPTTPRIGEIDDDDNEPELGEATEGKALMNAEPIQLPPYGVGEADTEWKEVLQRIFRGPKLKSFLQTFEGNHYDEIELFPELTDNDLRNLGMRGGSIMKWRRVYPSPRSFDGTYQRGH